MVRLLGNLVAVTSRHYCDTFIFLCLHHGLNNTRYSCSLDGTVEDTSGCVAYTEGETCEVDYFENDDVVALGKPLWSYCTWSFCLTSGQNEPSTDYCDQSEMRCSGCGGTWCQGHDGDLPTTAARETTTLAISTTKIFTTTRNAVDTTGGTLPTTSSTIQTTLPVEKTTSAAASTTSATNGYCSWCVCLIRRVHHTLYRQVH